MQVTVRFWFPSSFKIPMKLKDTLQASLNPIILNEIGLYSSEETAASYVHRPTEHFAILVTRGLWTVVFELSNIYKSKILKFY